MNTDLSVKVKGIPNRINSEIANLYNQSDFVSSERKENSILITVIKSKNKYQLELPNDYPFKPPKNIIYNGVNYKQILSNCPKKIQKILQTKYFINCLCCETITCSKWVPAINTSHIINEIDKFLKIKKEIRIILQCDEIREKGKCYFAEFEKYLF
jgi:ubiquitin-protein ligase